MTLPNDHVDSPALKPWLQVLHRLNGLYARGLHDLKVVGRCPVPATGPAILVANHTAGLDPSVLQSTCPRVIVWMMTSAFYEMRALGWLFRSLDAISVDAEGAGSGAVRAALRALRDGRVLGIFPEGRIEKTPELMPLQDGVAMFALRSGAPVCPAWIEGTQRRASMLEGYLCPQQVEIRFGAPFRLSDASNGEEAVRRGTGRIRDALLQLAPGDRVIKLSRAASEANIPLSQT